MSNIYDTSLVQYAVTVPDTESLLTSLGYSESRVSSIQRCLKYGYVKHEGFVKNNINHFFECGCNSRLCPHCVEKMKKQYRRALRTVISSYKQPRFLTVGFRNTPDLTKDYLKKCSYQFNRFVRNIKRKSRQLEKQGQRAILLGDYICVLEIKFHKKGALIKDKKTGKPIGIYQDNNWNVHYHIIFDGTFLPQKIASDILKKTTKGESQYVDIRYISREKIRSKMKALNYVTKYLSKMHTDTLDYKHSIEYYNAINKIRFVKICGKKPDPKLPSGFQRLFPILLNKIKDVSDALSREHELSETMQELGIKRLRFDDLDSSYFDPYSNYLEFGDYDLSLDYEEYKKIKEEN